MRGSIIFILLGAFVCSGCNPFKRPEYPTTKITASTMRRFFPSLNPEISIDNSKAADIHRLFYVGTKEKWHYIEYFNRLYKTGGPHHLFKVKTKDTGLNLPYTYELRTEDVYQIHAKMLEPGIDK